jgi:hypothetical protein
MKREIAKARRKAGYEFFAFQTVIDDLPASEIRQMADDYKNCIAWDLWAGTECLNVEIQKILIFWDFLDSEIVPAGISPVEEVFYRRTADRMAREGFLPRSIMEQFKEPTSVRTPPREFDVIPGSLRRFRAHSLSQI